MEKVIFSYIWLQMALCYWKIGLSASEPISFHTDNEILIKST